MKWYCKQFNELSVEEFHDILKLRIDVFVVEQTCIYPELDNKDQEALHVFGVDNNQIIAYSRVFKPGLYHQEAAIGRVVVNKQCRGKGLGYDIVSESLKAIKENYHTTTVWISAQTHLKKLYEQFDFKQVGEGYLEDGIPHIAMLKA